MQEFGDEIGHEEERKLILRPQESLNGREKVELHDIKSKAAVKCR
jgi:hypothetical protein